MAYRDIGMESVGERQSKVSKASGDSKMKTQLKPPICYQCKKPLREVYENEYWTYTFDEETGTCISELVDIEIRCPNCNANLRREFPEGLCNYVPRNKR